MLRNLATRDSNGIAVSLDYDTKEKEIRVSVKSESEDFTLYPPNACALDCFEHPYAYADRVLKRGTFVEVR